MSKARVTGFGLSVDGFNAGIEQSLRDPFGSCGRLGDRHCACGGRVAGNRRAIRKLFLLYLPSAVRSPIGLELEIVIRMLAGACNHPNCLVLPFRLDLTQLAA
jgi:hypothetical protein